MILLEEYVQTIKNHRRMCFKGTYQLKKEEMKKKNKQFVDEVEYDILN